VANERQDVVDRILQFSIDSIDFNVGYAVCKLLEATVGARFALQKEAPKAYVAAALRKLLAGLPELLRRYSKRRIAEVRRSRLPRASEAVNVVDLFPVASDDRREQR
jgi:hypothetical protein